MFVKEEKRYFYGAINDKNLFELSFDYDCLMSMCVRASITQCCDDDPLDVNIKVYLQIHRLSLMSHYDANIIQHFMFHLYTHHIMINIRDFIASFMRKKKKVES